MLYHTDEKPHCCKVCGRSFKELSTLQNHERIHSGERPFVCETCGKSFRQRVSYLVHRRIHTGALPYSCTTCGRKFRYKVTQRTHKCATTAHDDQAIAPGPADIGENREGYNIAESQSQQINASIANSMPPLSQEIKKDLLSMKQAHCRRQFSSRIQNILSKTNKKSNQAHSETSPTPHSLLTQPLSELSRLCLDDLGEPDWDGPLPEEGGVTLHSDGISEQVTVDQLHQLQEINNVFIDFNGEHIELVLGNGQIEVRIENIA